MRALPQCVHSDISTSVAGDLNPLNIVSNLLSIATINVCGLKSKLLSSEFIDLINKYDIICITKTKLDKYDCINIDNYSIFVNNRDSFYNKSGGIAFLVRSHLVSNVKVLAKTNSSLTLSLSQEVLGFACVLIGVYIPPEGSSYARDDSFSELEQVIIEHDVEKDICVIGDFNARTGTLIDYVENNDFNRLNYSEAVDTLTNNGFDISRASKDSVVNNYGHKLLDICKNFELFIANGRLYNDFRIGNFTCKGKSVVDYVLLSSRLFINASSFRINEFSNLFSDVHCVVECSFKSLKLAETTGNDDVISSGSSAPRRPIWNNDVKAKFINVLENKAVTDLDCEFNRIEAGSPTENDIVYLSNAVVDFITQIGVESGSVKTYKKKG